MLLRQRVSAVISYTSPERIWDFASDPKNWTASNPVEHRGLELFTNSGRPETGAMFHQQEYVAGVFADLGRAFSSRGPPERLLWTGIAKYRFLGGLLRIRIAKGGTATLTGAGNGWELAHDVFMDYSDSLFGKLLYWGFVYLFDGQRAVFEHASREAVYLKTYLEAESGESQVEVPVPQLALSASRSPPER